MTTAAAPSFIPDEFPAVTVPFKANALFNFDSFSNVVDGFGNSSHVTRTGPEEQNPYRRIGVYPAKSVFFVLSYALYVYRFSFDTTPERFLH